MMILILIMTSAVFENTNSKPFLGPFYKELNSKLFDKRTKSQQEWTVVLKQTKGWRFTLTDQDQDSVVEYTAG